MALFLVPSRGTVVTVSVLYRSNAHHLSRKLSFPYCNNGLRKYSIALRLPVLMSAVTSMPAGIWGGLITLPEGGMAEAREFARRHGFRLLDIQPLPGLRHSFSHFHLNIQPLLCAVEARTCLVAEAGWQWLEHDEIETAALPTPIRRLFRGTLQ